MKSIGFSGFLLLVVLLMLQPFGLAQQTTPPTGGSAGCQVVRSCREGLRRGPGAHWERGGAAMPAGCCGAGTVTAALRGIQDEAGSKLPVLGYTVPYAVGNILLTAWGPVIVVLTR